MKPFEIDAIYTIIYPINNNFHLKEEIS